MPEIIRRTIQENSSVPVFDMKIEEFSKRNVMSNISLYEIILGKLRILRQHTTKTY